LTCARSEAGSGTPRPRRSSRRDQFEAIRLIVPAGTEIPSHRVPGEITLHCLEGHVALGLAGTEVELKAGEWMYLEGGADHSVRGLEDSSVLLTIMFTHGNDA